jgi:hypothetical protein
MIYFQFVRLARMKTICYGFEYQQNGCCCKHVFCVKHTKREPYETA